MPYWYFKDAHETNIYYVLTAILAGDDSWRLVRELYLEGMARVAVTQ